MNIKDGINLVTLNDFEDLHSGVAFHYAQRKYIPNIFSEGGIRGIIGDNSKGALGKEAIPKPFISYGLEGQMQLFNRLLNAARQIPLAGLRTSNKHSKYLPQSSKDKEENKTLSAIESFEMIREYLDDHIYYVFEAEPTKYEKSISDDDIERINLAITELAETQEIKKIDEEDKRISSSIQEEEKKQVLEEIRTKRANLSIALRKKSKKLIDQMRGKLLDDSGVFEEIDYNEEKRKWTNQLKNPHNVHTKIVEDEEGIHGVTVSSNGSKKFGAFSIDGETIATANDAVKAFYTRVKPEDRLAITEDPDMTSMYIKYLELCKQYEKMGLLVEQNGRKVVDLEHIENFPGLQEFAEELEQYKIAQRTIISAIMQKEKEERHSKRDRIKPTISESVKAMSEDKDVEKIIGEGEATGVLLDLEKDQVPNRGVDIGDSN